MHIDILHRFDLSPAEAIKVQKKLQKRVDTSHHIDTNSIKLIAGSDLAYNREKNTAIASIVVMAFPSLSVVEETCSYMPITFPYIPGLLSFREIPAMVEAARKLSYRPDVWLIDGAGIAHPRGIGLASHWGLMVGIPTVGCAKSHLYGDYAEPSLQRGSFSPIRSKGGRIIGLVLRTRTGVRPLFISPGHLIDVESSKEIVLATCRKYRNPEPLRYAHNLADICKKGGQKAPPPERSLLL